MAYFNHAFQKLLLGTNTTSAANVDNGWFTGAQASITTSQIAPAVIAAVTATVGNGSIPPNTVLDGNAAVPTLAVCPQIYLAQGSINTKDKLGPHAGGYKESVKTKGINPRYVTKFYKQPIIAPAAFVGDVDLCGTDVPQCGTSYYLRVDVKGSPALRFLTHNLSRTFGSTNICCPTNPADSTDIEPMTVFASWAHQIARDPLMSQFVAPSLTWNNGSFNVVGYFAANPTSTDTMMYTAMLSAGGFVTGTEYIPGTSTTPKLLLTGSYQDTAFGNCSFDPHDFYELAPVYIYTSITDQEGDPCVDQIFCTSTVTNAQQGSGYGHRYIRDLILFRRYLQEHYVSDPRLREVMDQDVITNSGLVGGTQYVEYGILHSVPRFNNPSGVFDNDQYLVTIVVPAASTSFETWMQAYIALGGAGVTMETI